jgi:hypothetical protein
MLVVHERRLAMGISAKASIALVGFKRKILAVSDVLIGSPVRHCIMIRAPGQQGPHRG